MSISDNIVFIQFLGFIALGFGVFAFMSKNDSKMKILLTIQAYILSAHFFLLGANGATIATFITGTRNFTSLYSKLNRLAPLFIIFYVMAGLYYYKNLVDILPIISSVISTTALFYLKEIPMRLFFLVSTSIWIIHNIIIVSIGPLIMDILIFFISLRTINYLCKKDT